MLILSKYYLHGEKMPTKKSYPVYVTLRVLRPLSAAEERQISRMKSDELRKWELDRHTLLFEVAVLANDVDDAIARLRTLLASPELVIEPRNGAMKNDKKVQAPKQEE